MKAKNFIQAYETALATQQWENIAPLISEKASVTFSNGVVHFGKEAVRKAFETNFSIIKNEEYKISNVRWLIQEELFGVYLFDFNWAGIIQGNLVKGSGIGTSVIIKENDTWVLLTEHLGRKA